MPYAAKGEIRTDTFDGAIRITADQHAEALEGMCKGLVVTIEGGFKVAEPMLPEPPAPPELTPEDLAVNAIFQRDHLLSIATVRIAPLQDAVDLRDASEADIASLNQWKKYRIALNRIDQQAGFPETITWPEPPEASAPQ